MDEDAVRRHADAHAAAAVRGDLAAMAADVGDEPKAELSQLAQLLPQPVQQADVLSVTPEGDQAVVRIHFAGPGRQATIETRWRDEDGRPKIVAAAPIG